MGWGVEGGRETVLELEGRKNPETSEGFKLAETRRVADPEH